MAKIKLDLSGTSFASNSGQPAPKLDLSGTSFEKKNPIQPISPSQNDMASSGAKPSAAGNQEEDGWFSNLKNIGSSTVGSLKDFVVSASKGAFNNAADTGIQMGRNLMVGLVPDMFFSKEKMTFDQKADAYNKNIAANVEKVKGQFREGASADIYNEKEGFRIPDADALGEVVGKQLMQLGLNANVGGLVMNHLSNTEANYREAKQKGLSEKEAFVMSNTLGLTETLMDKFLGVDRLVSKAVSKGVVSEVGKKGIAQLADKVLSFGAFKAGIETGEGAFKRLLKQGILPEMGDEFLQTYIGEGEKMLFDQYKKAVDSDDPNAKLSLYDADALSSKTFITAVNSSFIGGLIGGMGAGIVGTDSYTPTVYASLLNSYDSQGKQGLDSAVEDIRKGLTKASEKGTLDADAYNNSLKNVDKIAENVAKFEQKSKADPYSRYVLYDHAERIIPETANRIARTLAEATTPLELPTQDQIDNNIGAGEVSLIQFQQENQVPEAYKPYSEAKQDEAGNSFIEATIPNSVVEAYNANQVAVQTAMTNPLFAIDSLTNNNKIVTIDDIKRIGQQGGATGGDLSQQLNFNIAFEANKKSFAKALRVINYAKGVSNSIVNGKVVATEELRNAYMGIYSFNEGDTVFYNNKSAKVMDISPDGQMLKLSGVQEQIAINDNNLRLQDSLTEQAAPTESEQEVAQTLEAEVPVEQAPVVRAPLAEEEQITGRTMRDAVGELIPFTLDGETGEIYTTSSGVVTFESPNKVVEFGNIKDVGDRSIDEFGIVPQEMSIGNDFSVTIDGKAFTNKNQNPFRAITYDADGNAVSIKLDNEKGQTRVIKGTRAVVIDAKYKVKQLFDESTREQLAAATEDAANQAAAIEDTRGQFAETPTPTASKPVEQAPSIAQRESAERVRAIAERLAAEETEQMTQNRQSVANLASSLFSSGIQVEVMNAEQIRIKYGNNTEQGMFLSNTGTVVLNESILPSEWGKTIIFHEGTHPVINIIRNTEPKLYKQLVDAINQEAKTNPEVNQILLQIKNSPRYGDEFTRNDELVVEAIARIASGKLKLSDVKPTLRQAIINFINKIGKVMGFNQVLKDTDEVAFNKLANQISEVLNAGRDISEIVGAKNVGKFAVASDIQSTSENSAIYGGGIQASEIERAKVSNKPLIDVYQKEDVVELPIRSMKDIYDNYGGKVVMINSDATRVGNLKLPSGKEIFLYGGTEYIALKKNVDGNVGFATTLEGKLKTHEKLRDAVFGKEDGATLVVSQAPPAILSNSYTLRYLLDAISQLPKSVLSNPKFKSEFLGKDNTVLQKVFGAEKYKEFIEAYADTDFTSKESIDLMVENLGYKLSSDSSPLSFKIRGALASNSTAKIVEKSKRVATKDEKGYISMEPKNIVAKALFDQFGINSEKIIRDLGSKGIVDEYFDNGIWGLAVGGFETSADTSYTTVQDKGVTHPLFNAKFYGKNPFVLDSGYKVDDLILPTEIIDKNDNLYTKKTSIMLSTSIYVGGDIEAQLSALDRDTRVAPNGQPSNLNEYQFQFSDLSRDDKRIQAIRRDFSTYPKGEIVQALMGEPFNLTKEKAEDLVARAFADPLAPSLPTGNPDTAIPEGSKVNEKSNTVDEYNAGYNKYKKALLDNTVGRWKSLMKGIALEYDSRFFARRKLGLASSEASLAQAQLRNLNGIAYSASQDLAKLYEDIFGNGLGENGIETLGAMIFNLRVMQVDRNTENAFQDEVERLSLEFIAANNRTPTSSEARTILVEARKNVPIRAHGKTKDGIPATSQTSKSFLDALRLELGENEYNMLKGRADMFKKAGNDLVEKLRKAGIISDDVANSYKDDFYAFRMTLDKLYGKEDASIVMMNGVPAIKGWSALSKQGTENYINQDARLMLAQSYIGTARAVAKNAFRESVFNENIKTDQNGNQQSVIALNGETITFVKPANYIKDANGNVRSNGKELSVRDAEEGYVNVPFKKDGVVNYYQMEKEIFDQLEGNNIKWKDAELSGAFSNAYYSTTDFANRMLTGFATRNNPFFWIGNVPMDLQQQIFFTDIWTQGSLAQSNVYVAGARAVARTIKFSNFFGRNTEFVDKTLEEFIAAGGAMDRMSTMKEQRQRSINIATVESQDASKLSKMMKKAKSGLKTGVTFMNERTEIAMRLAAYDQSKKNLIKKFEEDNNGAKPNESQMIKIQEIAASQSRAYTDFSQRGVSLPNLNIAYLNSSIQAAGAAAEYIYDNPAKASAKVGQLVVGKFLGTMAIMAIMGDAYDELDEYRKDLYSFAFSKDTGLKDKDGNPIFVTADIRNNPTLTPVLGVTRRLAERTMRALQSKEQEDVTVLGTLDEFTNLLNQAMPIAIPNITSVDALKKSALQLFTKHTIANASIKAFMGFDAFRNKDIISERDKKLSPYMQGMDDPNVPYFYKLMAKSMAGVSSSNQVSPATMQAVAETFITSPRTNPFVGLMYMTLSDVANAIIPAKTDNERGAYTWGEPSKIMKSVTGRFATFTDAQKADFRKNEELYILSKEESMKFNDTERVIDNQLKDLYAKDEKNFFANVDKMAKDEGYFDNIPLMERIDRKVASLDKGEFKKSFVNADIVNEVKILHYTQGAEGKARILKYMFDNDTEKARQVIDGLIDYGTSAKEAYDTEDLYNKMIKNK